MGLKEEGVSGGLRDLWIRENDWSASKRERIKVGVCYYRYA